MILADNSIEIPREWYHDALVSNNYGQTVAMIYATNGMIPPKEWEHDPNL